MPSLFALLHFNTQSHTKLLAEDLMPLLVHFRVSASAKWKRLRGGDGAGESGAVSYATHILNVTRVKGEATQIKGSSKLEKKRTQQHAQNRNSY